MKKCDYRILIVIVFMISFLLAACGKSTISPATATARARRVSAQATNMAVQLRNANLLDEKQATATMQARLDRLALSSSWPVVLSDTFDDNTHEWVVGPQTGQYGDATFTIANGVYHWAATSKEGFVWWNHPAIESVTDFHLAVDARQVNGPANAYIGLVMRLTENDDYYLFSVQNKGNYSFDVYNSGQWLSLIPWTPSPVILADETNRVEALAEGGHFSFYVNGEWLADYEDQTIGSGYCGLAAGIEDAGVSAAWEFDNFELRGASSPDETPTIEVTATP